MTTAFKKVTNRATAQLSANITGSPSTFSVTSGGSLFPSTTFLVTIDDEIIHVSSRSGNTFTIAGRGQEGTTQVDHSSGANVQLRVLASHVTELQNAINTFESEPLVLTAVASAAYDAEIVYGTSMNMRGVAGSRPAASAVNIGAYYASTDGATTVGKIERSNGSTWDLVGGLWRPACKARRTSSLSVSNNIPTAIPFDATDDYDTDTMHDPASNSTRITCKTAGVYRFEAYTHFATNSSGVRQMWFHINGSTVAYWGLIRQTPISSGEHALGTSFDVKLAVNDYVECFVQQNSGAALNLHSNSGFPTHFSASFLTQAT